MNKIIPNLLLAGQLVLIASCGNAQAVIGSGHIITETRAVTTFTQLETGGIFNIKLLQGDKEEVVIEADDNIMPLILVENIGEKLKLSTKKRINIKKSEKTLITVTAKSLQKLICAGVGNISTPNTFKSDKLDVSCNGVGNINLNLACSQLTVKSTGVGNVALSGTALNANIKNDGVGNLDAENLIVEILHIENSGVGNTNATANKEAYLEDSGVGNVKFKGNAAIKHLEKSGVGKISVN